MEGFEHGAQTSIVMLKSSATTVMFSEFMALVPYGKYWNDLNQLQP
jgi:hypothetical protein